MRIECKNCRFFEPLEWEPAEGACHRFPWKFRRGIHDWCGEAQQDFKVDVAKAARDEDEFYEGFRREA